MNQYDFNKLMEKYLAGACTPEEAHFVEAWAQHYAVIAEQALDAPAEAVTKKRAWLRLRKTALAKGTTRKLWHRAIAMAAVLAALVAGLQMLYRGATPVLPVRAPAAIFISYINTEQQPRQLSLADGTTVTVQPNSSLKYPVRFSGGQRRVYLTGEAFFNVVRNPRQPFLVQAGGLITEVLGTSFTVRSLSNVVEVAVVSGRVSVYEQGTATTKKPLILTPNQKATYLMDSHKLVAGIVDTPAALAPQAATAALLFDDTPLTDVLTALSKNFGLEIRLQNPQIGACTISGDLTGLPLADQLDLVCKAVNASHRRSGNSILIAGGDACR